jgi:radical SAM superfamily enzyme YgiQ (UPF0313 family)
MGGAASFLNPEPIAEFTDVIGVGEGEVLVPQLLDTIFENEGTKDDLLVALARRGRGFYVPSLYEVTYKDDGTGRTLHAEDGRRACSRRSRCLG